MRGGSSITCVLPLFPLAAVLQRPPSCLRFHPRPHFLCHICTLPHFSRVCVFLLGRPPLVLPPHPPPSFTLSLWSASLSHKAQEFPCLLAGELECSCGCLCAHTHAFYSHASEGRGHRGHRGSPGHRTLLSASLPPPRHPPCLLFLHLLRPLNGCSLVLSQRFTQLGALVAD